MKLSDHTNKQEIIRIRKQYYPCQLLLMGSWMYWKFQQMDSQSIDRNIFLSMLGHVGMILFSYCLVRLYVWKPSHLITTGVFKYTRHPMYTGLALNAISLWWPTYSDLSIGYWLSLATFVVAIVTAGYLQENETLVRFGAEAEEYYSRTPRIFLWYPLS